MAAGTRDVEPGPGPNQTSLLMASVCRLLRPWPSDFAVRDGSGVAEGVSVIRARGTPHSSVK